MNLTPRQQHALQSGVNPMISIEAIAHRNASVLASRMNGWGLLK